MTNIETVVTFGDSWPAGTELSDNHEPFGDLIAQHYRNTNKSLRFTNYAVPGTSIDHMIIRLDSFIKNESTQNTLAIFFLTDYSRSIIWKNNKFETVLVNNDDDSTYWKNYYSDEYGIFRANQALLTLQHMCKQYQINDYYIVGWTKFPLTLSGIDKDKIFEQGNKSCLNLFKIRDDDNTDDSSFIFCDYNYYIKPNVCHPNLLGHQTISANLINWIDHNENKKAANENKSQ